MSNAGGAQATVSVAAITPDDVFGSGGESIAGGDGAQCVDVIAQSTVVLMADRQIDTPEASSEIVVVRPAVGAEIPTVRCLIEDELFDDR